MPLNISFAIFQWYVSMKLRMMASLDSGLIVVVAILGFCGAILVRKIPNSFCIAILVMKAPNSFFFAIFVRKTKKTCIAGGKAPTSFCIAYQPFNNHS